MRLQLLQENFSKALSLCQPFISSKAQLPVLSNILLKTSKTKLMLSATNLEISLSTSIGAKVEEEGSITVPAKTLADLISNLGKQTLELKTDKEALKIKGENFSANLPGLNSSEFPQIPDAIDNDAINFKRGDLLKALAQVVFSASSDEARPVLTGVLFTSRDDALVLVGTDGFRLSQKKIALGKNILGTNAIIPKVALLSLGKIAHDYDTVSLQLKHQDNQILFKSGENILSSRVIDGQFPPFEKIIPKQTSVVVNVDREEFLRAVKVASVFARDAGFIGKVRVSDSGLSISAESSKSGSQETSVAAKVIGEPLEILYNLHFVEEFLSVASGDEIEIGLTDSNSPGIFKDSSDRDFLHLIMPVKI